jgi:antitoxin component HigA of HigAB toxin-antitoxin module
MKYEQEHYPIGPADDAAILWGRLDAMGITQARMARDTGIAESTISAVLHGSRKFTRAQIAKVAAYLKVPPHKFKYED